MKHSNQKLSLLAALLCVAGLTACSTSETVTSKPISTSVEPQSDLYDGKPTLSLEGDFPPASQLEAMNRGDAAYLQGNPDLALYEYIRALQMPDEGHAELLYYNIGYIHQQRNNLPLAKLAYSRAYDGDDQMMYAAALGVVEMKLGEKLAAKQHLLHAIELDQERLKPETVAEEGDGVTAIPETHVTAAMANKQLKVDMQSPYKAYLALGIIADLEQNYDTGQYLYSKVLEVNPKSVQALVNMGYSHYLDGNLDEAEYYNKRAAALKPSEKRAWSNLGLVFVRKEQYDLALEAFSRVMPDAEAMNDVGYFAMLDENYEAAIEYLEMAITASPTYYPKAQQNLKRAEKLKIKHPPVQLAQELMEQEPVSQPTVFDIDQ